MMEWISVNVRLPENTDEVFVTDGEGSYGCSRYWEDKNKSWSMKFNVKIRLWCKIPEIHKYCRECNFISIREGISWNGVHKRLYTCDAKIEPIEDPDRVIKCKLYRVNRNYL